MAKLSFTSDGHDVQSILEEARKSFQFEFNAQAPAETDPRFRLQEHLDLVSRRHGLSSWSDIKDRIWHFDARSGMLRCHMDRRYVRIESGFHSLGSGAQGLYPSLFIAHKNRVSEGRMRLVSWRAMPEVTVLDEALQEAYETSDSVHYILLLAQLAEKMICEYHSGTFSGPVGQ